MKKKYCMFTAIILLACTAVALAQGDKPPQQRNIAEALDSWITNTETHVVPVAAAMPEDKYSFAPAPTSGEFRNVRTFAEQLKHLAANNYGMAALILEEKRTPEMTKETGPDSLRTKAEIMEYLTGSFAALHKAVATINENNVVQPTASPSSWQKTRISFAVDAVAHCFDHYGQLVEYLRMNGIVPPDSR
jgi:uncharacterized damage-inducible protein DinB